MKKDKEQRGYRGSDRAFVVGSICSVAFILLIAIGGMVFFHETMIRSTALIENGDYESYDAYYAFIVSDGDSSLWKSVYESAKEAAKEENIYVEMLGSNLSTNYTRKDLLEIAIASGVDGIILEADESPQITECLKEAETKGIPVVTVLGDNSQGLRKSFVGVSNYNFGREYGRQVLSIADEKVEDVLVLMSADTEDSSQNIIFSGIQETLQEDSLRGGRAISVRASAVENKGAFDTEESIRKLFLQETLPDVIICLDELSTSCVYQAVVDYNKVGQIDIIGYYDSEAILRAIERNVVRSTISIDTQEMGRCCIEAMNEYRENGYVSEYFSVGTNLITIQNVRNYLRGGEGDEQAR